MNYHTAIRALISVLLSALLLMASVSQAQEYSFQRTGSLHTARFIHTATLLDDGTVLVSGGGTGSTCPYEPTVATFEIYNAQSGTWSSPGVFPARAGHSQTRLFDGSLLAVGGVNNPDGCGGNGQYLNDAYLYSPKTKVWDRPSTFTTARTGHTATLLANGKVLIAGGRSANATLETAELYDHKTNSWSSTASMHYPRIGHSAIALLDGKILVAGGGGVDSNIQSELYDPKTNTWALSGALNVPRSRTDALVLLTDGKVLYAGGYNGAYLDSAELYDPNSGTWALTGKMSISRAGMSTTSLADGRVIAIADFATSNQTTEIYDPDTGTWSLASSLVDVPTRGIHTATMLLNGDVLIAGGRANAASGYPRKTASSELYTVKGN